MGIGKPVIAAKPALPEVKKSNGGSDAQVSNRVADIGPPKAAAVATATAVAEEKHTQVVSNDMKKA